jgi:hypothetical protein
MDVKLGLLHGGGKRRLKVLENRLLRRIFRPEREEGTGD